MRWLLILGILLILLSRTRLGIRMGYDGQTATASLTVGPFRIQLIPGKTRPAKEKKEPKPPRPKKPPKQKTALPRTWTKPTWADVQDAYRTLAPACKKALGRTRRSIRISPLQVSITLPGAKDPVESAELYGYLHGAVWTVMPPLEQLLDIRNPHIHIGIDFDAETLQGEGALGISIRIGTLVAVGFGMGIPALRWLLRFRKQHLQQPPAPPVAAEPVDHAAA